METKKFIVRSVDAGVFYGEIKEKNGNEVTMVNSRCLHYWEGAGSLNQIAMEGVKCPGNCRFTMPADEIVILGVCEILPCTNEACECIDSVKAWRI